MKKILNSLNTQELLAIECLPTRQNKLIITCGDKVDLEKIKSTIEADENVQQKMDIRESRMARITVFGAPNKPPIPKKLSDSSNASQQRLY